MKHVLVTGSDGYIGMVLIELLKKLHYRVVPIDNLYYKKNFLGPHPQRIKHVQKDIRRLELSDFKGVDAVIHLAALSNDPLGAIRPDLTNSINHVATIRLAKLAKQAGVKRFIYSSSCSIYGIASGTVSETSPIRPLTAYAKSKIDSENDLKKLADTSFCVCLLRNSTVYGFSPKFRTDLVVNNMVASAVTTGEIRIMSDGTPWRPLIDVRDLSRVFCKFLTVNANKVNGIIFNVGFNENNVQVKTIVKEIKRQLPNCNVVFTGEHGKDTRSYKVNFHRLHTLFPSFKQKWPMSKSIADMIIKLKQFHLSAETIKNGTYTRVISLEKLTKSKQLTADLYWK